MNRQQPTNSRPHSHRRPAPVLNASLSTLLWCIVLFLAATLPAAASEVGDEPEPPCRALLRQSLTRLSDSVSVASLTTAGAEMQRISEMCPQDWLPCYYVAFLGIQKSLMQMNDPATIERMGEYLKWIDKAEKMKTTDPAETHALRAYYYYVLIALNPAANGQAYYQSVFRECEAAMNEEPLNPRAKVIRYVFEKQMGTFLGGKTDDDGTERKKIEQLFDAEDSTSVEPTWGRELLTFLKYTGQ